MRTCCCWSKREEMVLSYKPFQLRLLTEPRDTWKLCFYCPQQQLFYRKSDCEWALAPNSYSLFPSDLISVIIKKPVSGLEGITCSQRTRRGPSGVREPLSEEISSLPQRSPFLNCLNLGRRGVFHDPGVLPASV